MIELRKYCEHCGLETSPEIAVSDGENTKMLRGNEVGSLISRAWCGICITPYKKKHGRKEER